MSICISLTISSLIFAGTGCINPDSNSRAESLVDMMFVAQNWLRTHSYVWHDSVICLTWLIYMFVAQNWLGILRENLTEDLYHTVMSTLTSVWLIHECDMTQSHVWHDSILCVTKLSHMCDRTHSYVWQDLLVWVTWLIHMREMTHSHVWQDWFTCVTWLIHMCDMTQSCVWHDSFMCVTWLICMRDMTHQPFINRLEFVLGIQRNVTPAKKNGRLPRNCRFSYSEN